MKELRYQLSKEDYMDWIHWNVGKQDMRKSRRFSIILYAAFFIFYLGSGIASGKGIQAVMSSLITLVLLGFAMFYMISAKNRERMIWKRSGLKKLEKTNNFPKIILTPHETGITMEVPGQVKNEFAFTDIAEIEETPRLYLLGTTDNKWQFLAKSAFDSLEEMEQFKAFLEEKVADAKENPEKYQPEDRSEAVGEVMPEAVPTFGSEGDDGEDDAKIAPVDTSNMGKIGKIAHMMAALDASEKSGEAADSEMAEETVTEVKTEEEAQDGDTVSGKE